MENGPFTDDFPNKTSIYNGFSIAMLNYQRVWDGAWDRFITFGEKGGCMAISLRKAGELSH